MPSSDGSCIAAVTCEYDVDHCTDTCTILQFLRALARAIADRLCSVAAVSRSSFSEFELFGQPSRLGSHDKQGVVLLFFYGFGNAAAYVLARTIADSSFLSQFGYEHLPELVMLSAGVVALSSVGYSYLLDRFGLQSTVIATLSIFAGLSLVFLLLMLRLPNSLTVFTAAYLLAQIRGSLGTIQYATALNEQFGRRRPERVVGLAGTGATLAGIAMGGLIWILSSRMNVQWLLIGAAVIDALTMLPLIRLRALRRARFAQRADETLHAPDANRGSANGDSEFASDASGRQQNEASDATDEVAPNDIAKLQQLPASSMPSFQSVRRSKYVILIAASVTLCILSTTFVEYQWKVTATNEFQFGAGKLASYFGIFYGVVYLVTGVLQLFVTERILRRGGIFAGLVAFPATLLTLTCLAWFATSDRLLFWMLTLCKGTDTLRRGLFDPTLQVLYAPLGKDLRRQAITFVAGISKPFAEAVAGILMVCLARVLTPQQFSPLVALFIIVWLVLAAPLWRRFRALRD